LISFRRHHLLLQASSVRSTAEIGGPDDYGVGRRLSS
jgi:hypothetical protein